MIMMKSRYYTLDAIRGFALVNMIIYHALWDMVYIFNYDIPWYTSRSAYLWQQCICYIFIFLSGFCFSLGSKKLKRGLIVFGAGALISLVTYIVMPNSFILFGVLTLIGSCMLIMNLLDKLFIKINPYIGLVVSLFLFIITRNVNEGYLGFECINLCKLPNSLYSSIFSSYLGFTEPSFSSSDYFSLTPWLFLYIGGYFTKKIIDKKGVMGKFIAHQNFYLEYLGQHSLIVYLLHQPIMYLILLLLN